MERANGSAAHIAVRRMSIVKAALAAALLVMGYTPSALAAGTVSGQVTNAVTHVGIAGAKVTFYDFSDGDGDINFTATADASGNYSQNLPDGSYVAVTTNAQGYVNKIWNNVPCSATCDINSIQVQPIAVAGGAVSGIDFALTPGGGRIAGTITSSATGNPIVGALVFFVDGNGNFAFSTATTDNAGHYVSDGGTDTGTVFVVTASGQGFQDESYNNHKCTLETCDIADPVAVTFGATTNNINFALDPGGRISGTVRDVNNAPLANVNVQVANSTGDSVDEVLTDALGNFITSGLASGTYYVGTDNNAGLVDYVWPNLLCPSGFCNQTDGTPISVTVPNTTSGINFVLTPGQTISGTVTAGGAPLPDVFVGLNNAVGAPVGGAFTDASGTFTTGAVPPGTYYAAVFQNGYVGQIYSNLSCTSGCPITNGTPIVVSNQPRTGINFSLVATGVGAATSITGTVLNGTTNQPFNPGISVQLVTPSGGVPFSTTTNPTTGVYTFASIPTGTYYVRTNTGLQINGTAFVNQIYNGVSCLNSCSILTNAGTTPVTVTPGGTISGINFTLAQGGLITGTVTAAASNAPLSGISAQVFNSAGVSFGTYNTDASGNYRAGGLPAGTYYVRTANNAGFVNQLWQATSCPQTGCLVTSGTPVVVTGTATTPGINFALASGGRISGKVTDASTNPQQPLQNVQVAIFSSSGVGLGSANTDASGNYTTSGLPPGTYFMRTGTGPIFSNNQTLAFVDELWNDIRCVPACLNPTAGTPVTVTNLGNTTNVDFALTRGSLLSGAVIDAATGAGIPSIGVQIYTSDGVLAKAAATNAGGGYTVAGLPPGTYYARTSAPVGSAYLDALYKGMPCSSGCSVTTGTPIMVVSGVNTPGVDFALSSGGGSLSGTITDKRTAQPLPNIFVQIYTAAGVFTKTAATNIAGAYATGGLAPGTYYARTFQEIPTGHANQLYSNGRCTLTSCTVTNGTAIVVAAGATTGGIDFALAGLLAKSDFDADGKADFAVWRTQTGTWYSINTSDGGVTSRQWGLPGAPFNDVPVPGDYDGDGKTDFAVWRTQTSTWHVINSSNGSVTSRQWGIANDVPVPGDYDGDGKTDFAVWRPSTGTWHVINSSNGSVTSRQWGLAFAPFNDVPVAADYDGDGKTDLAVFRTQTSTWHVINSSNGSVTSRQWGIANDTPVPGDYDGDGKTDFAVWRSSTGTWHVINSSNGSVTSRQWGLAFAPHSDVPVAADYDGDGKADFAVWRMGTGTWWVINSSNGSVTSRQWGLAFAPFNDVPVPSSGIQ